MRRARAWPYLWVALVCIAHRTALFVWHRGDLQALREANPKWYAFQLLPLSMLRERWATSLLYLQQSPPIPNIIMAIFAGRLGSPEQLAGGLVGFQAVITIATALVLVHIIRTLYPERPLVAAIVGSVFVLNTDLVVLEYNSFGQTFYENLTMFLVLVVVALLLRYRRTGQLRTAVSIGVVVAVLALTRASWSFFAIPCAALMAFLHQARRLRAVLLFLLPVILLQGGWAVKNWFVFGYLSPSTSSWAGWNLAKGMRAGGLAREFTAFVDESARGDGRPLECFLDHPGALFHHPPADDSLSPGQASPDVGEQRVDLAVIFARDRQIAARLGTANPFPNSAAMWWAARQCQEAAVAFCRARPELCLLKFWRGYELFWQPIANYGRMYVALFATSSVIKNGFDLPSIGRQLANGELPDRQYVMSGRWVWGRGTRGRPVETNLWTLRWLEPWILMSNLVAVHVLAPALLLLGWRTWSVRPASPIGAERRAALLIALGVYAYVAVIGNAVEYIENMRYRIEVEPIIWLITVISVAQLFALIRGKGANASAPAETSATTPTM